jgi:hypothetical protein
MSPRVPDPGTAARIRATAALAAITAATLGEPARVAGGAGR